MLNKVTKNLIITFLLFSLSSCNANSSEYWCNTYYFNIYDDVITFNVSDLTSHMSSDCVMLSEFMDPSREEFDYYKKHTKFYFKWQCYDGLEQKDPLVLYDAPFLDNNVFIFDSINNVSYALKTETGNDKQGKIGDEIANFVYDSIDSIKNYEEVKHYGSPFILLGIHNFSYLNEPYFTLNTKSFLWKYRFSEEASFYLLENETNFIPGTIAFKDNVNIHSNWRNFNNAIKITPIKVRNGDIPFYEDYKDQELDEIYGKCGEIILKESFPDNEGHCKKLTSKYVKNFILGYSFINGYNTSFNTDSNDYESGSDVQFNYSKIYDEQDPILKHSYDENDQSSLWKYSYRYPSSLKNDAKTYYLFEMNNHSDFSESEMILCFDYQFEVSNGPSNKNFSFNNYAYFSDRFEIVNDTLWSY